VPAPYKFTPPPPGEEGVPPGENNLDDEIERLASDPNPVAEAFREWAEIQDPVELRQISWNADIGRAADAIESIWNRILGEAKDKRAEDWEMLPEEQEFIDALRKVAKEASKRFRRGVVVYFKPAQSTVKSSHE
jgi:hypothetical protein